MKVIILCGGRGLRLNEFTQDIPKSMIDIRGKPLLWYICRHYQKYGFNDFIFCLGYKGEMIKEYFEKTDFNIQFIDTGENTTKTERLKQIEHLIDGNIFMLSYGDDLCDVDINKLLEFHKKRKAIFTLTAINLTSEFGIFDIKGNGIVRNFREKPELPYWINSGYYVLNKHIFFTWLRNQTEDFEKSIFPHTTQLMAFKHYGFWKPINTFKDVMELRENEKLLEE